MTQHVIKPSSQVNTAADQSTCGTGLANQTRSPWAHPLSISPTQHTARSMPLSPCSLSPRTKAAALVSWNMYAHMYVHTQFRHVCTCMFETQQTETRWVGASQPILFHSFDYKNTNRQEYQKFCTCPHTCIHVKKDDDANPTESHLLLFIVQAHIDVVGQVTADLVIMHMLQCFLQPAGILSSSLDVTLCRLIPQFCRFSNAQF